MLMANKFAVHCIHCDGTDIVRPKDGPDNGFIVCNGCGKRLGTVEEFKAEVNRQAAAKVAVGIQNMKPL
jgi:hypothetical protein